MKKIVISILILFLLVPSIVKADAIECDDGSFSHGDNFSCYVKVDKLENYDELSGTVTTDTNLSCEITGVGGGLTANPVSNPKIEFSLKGIPSSSSIFRLSCSVVGKPTVHSTSQITIKDYKYHVYGSTVDATNLVLRSNYININAYEDKEPEVVDTKPRDTSNNNSLLKAIYDKNLNFSFSKFVTIYDLEVLYEVEELDLTIMPVNTDALVELKGSETLALGLNVIDIYVTSPDKSTTTCYTLNVTRLARGVDIYYPKSDSSLDNLTIIGHSIKFEKEVYDYTIKISSDTNNVDINAKPTNEEALVDISNTTNLKNGDIITITVTSVDGTSETKYRILVNKELPKEDIRLYMILGGLLLISVIVIVLMIKNNKKEKEDPLLSIKTSKRKVKKGANFDVTGVPEVIINNSVQQAEVPTPTQPNVITASDATAAIIQAAPETMVDMDRNKVTAVQSTIDLNVSANAAPIAAPVNDIVAQDVQINNVTSSSLGNEAATLDLSFAVMPSELNSEAQNNNQVINPVGAVASPLEVQVTPQVLDPSGQVSGIVSPNQVNNQVVNTQVQNDNQVINSVEVVTPIVQPRITPEVVPQVLDLSGQAVGMIDQTMGSNMSTPMTPPIETNMFDNPQSTSVVNNQQLESASNNLVTPVVTEQIPMQTNNQVVVNPMPQQDQNNNN